MNKLLIALGSNQATYRQTPKLVLEQSLGLFERESLFPTSISAWYQTPAFPAETGTDFINGVAEVTTNLSEKDALMALHRIENEMGRVRADRWGARVCDLDLLANGDTVLPDRATLQAWMDLPLGTQMREAPETLLLPHPRLHERSFVLVPLADVAPDWVHPLLGASVTEMLASLPESDRAAVKIVETVGKVWSRVFPDREMPPINKSGGHS